MSDRPDWLDDQTAGDVVALFRRHGATDTVFVIPATDGDEAIFLVNAGDAGHIGERSLTVALSERLHRKVWIVTDASAWSASPIPLEPGQAMTELIAFAESDLTDDDVRAIEALADELAGGGQAWFAAPPEFVNEVDEHGVRTTGLIHRFPAARDAGGNPVAADVDRQALDEVSAIIVALERLAAAHRLVFGINLDGDTARRIDKDRPGQLREALLDPWAAHLGDLPEGAASVLIHAGTNKRGEPVLESVPADEISPGRFVLHRSPGLALGVAAGDTIDVAPDGRYEVRTRGGNLAVQVFATDFDERALGELRARVEELGGFQDGGNAGLRIFTLPVALGFPAVESAFDAFIKRNPSAEWHFGNVFADDGVTPLKWWETP
jgi:hypothetical protein